jgi:hypothetical protein
MVEEEGVVLLVSPLGVCIRVEIYRDCGEAADA